MLFQRLTNKLLSIDSHIESLLKLPHSKSMRLLFDTIIDFQVVAPAYGALTYNYSTDSFIKELVKDNTPTSYTKFIETAKQLKLDRKDNYRLEVHAECRLLSHLLEKGQRAYEYIGISKLCCASCWYFIKAYNDLAARKRMQYFHVRGTHARVYPWVAPMIRSRSDILDCMLPGVTDYFKHLMYEGKDRSTSESSAGSLSTHRINLDWDLLKAKIDQM